MNADGRSSETTDSVNLNPVVHDELGVAGDGLKSE